MNAERANEMFQIQDDGRVVGDETVYACIRDNLILLDGEFSIEQLDALSLLLKERARGG